jgi:hypothetical protein
MSDFLHKLRNGNEYRNSNDARFNKKRRQYDTGQGIVYDRRTNTESRRKNSAKGYPPQEQAGAQTSEALNIIRDLLQDIADSQERLANAEERKASALESIAEKLQSEKGVSLSITGEMTGGHKIVLREKRKRRAKKFDDPNRKRVMQIIDTMRKNNETYQDIADKLEQEGLKTFSGRGKWHAQTVHRLCQD